jgi:nucleoside-diphosphate-sugar epimerase
MQCDLTNDEAVSRVFAAIRERYGNRLASCIHLAAYYDFAGNPSALYRTLTVEGTLRVLRELRKFEAEQFAFSSTLLVMKPAEDEGEAITESSPVEGVWDYPRSKLAAETEIRREHGGIPAVILRMAGVYNEDCRSIPIAQHIARIYERKLESYFFPGDKDHGQAFIHLDDLVTCIEQVIERRGQLRKEEVFLLAEPDVMSYAELQEQLGELIHGEEWPTIRIPKVVAKAGAWVKDKLDGEEDGEFIKPWMIDLADDHYPVVMDHARQELGCEPRHRLRDTLPEMIARLKRNPAEWYKRNGLKPPEDIEQESGKEPELEVTRPRR